MCLIIFIQPAFWVNKAISIFASHFGQTLSRPTSVIQGKSGGCCKGITLVVILNHTAVPYIFLTAVRYIFLTVIIYITCSG